MTFLGFTLKLIVDSFFFRYVLKKIHLDKQMKKFKGTNYYIFFIFILCSYIFLKFYPLARWFLFFISFYYIFFWKKFTGQTDRNSRERLTEISCTNIVFFFSIFCIYILRNELFVININTCSLNRNRLGYRYFLLILFYCRSIKTDTL